MDIKAKKLFFFRKSLYNKKIDNSNHQLAVALFWLFTRADMHGKDNYETISLYVGGNRIQSKLNSVKWGLVLAIFTDV